VKNGYGIKKINIMGHSAQDTGYLYYSDSRPHHANFNLHSCIMASFKITV